MKCVVLLGMVVVLAGCTSARISRDLSSGVIGCPANDINIIDEDATMSGTHTWIAECNGKKHACSYHTTTGANCKEMVASGE